MTRLLVEPQQDGLRLDQYLAAASLLSRRQARTLIEQGMVWRNGTALRVQSRQLSTGDVIDVLRPGSELGCPARPEVTQVRLLHEDSWLAVADKPAGVLSQPAGGRSTELALDQQMLLFLAARNGRKPYLRLVHRLDRQTSGTALFALHSAALPPLTRSWQQGKVARIYVAPVQGNPDLDDYELTGSISRDSSHSWRFRVSPGGKPARTRVRVLSRLPDDITIVACALETGRTHQVRVHLADAGLPVLGDRLYGCPPVPGVQRPLLHAALMALPHPRSGAHIEVFSEPPADIAPFLQATSDLLLPALQELASCSGLESP
jgi:23S rRNA pseudouridine1911/1915/1917 synthase